ncbi:hypothetical protein Lal_00030914 [Lupinus albus]|uniref:Putative small heat shock protein HSP20 n=1 Tax=Lupinus albus TaxID=3870 RepID=A0A6A4P9L4_LUPAL|nr:putative small heat shock protein HSP20 [Lupinus albus]KAF1863804.1 hypothetical protein Lal_00030914 [Lupinus albus]
MAMIPCIFGTGRSVNFLRNPFATTSTTNDTSTIINTHINWKETSEAHIFKVDLPGLKNGDVKVDMLAGKVLQISGDWSKDKKEKNDTVRRLERSGGNFVRRFRLPENAKVEKVKACMENGVLTIIIPKEEVKTPYMKLVQIKG